MIIKSICRLSSAIKKEIRTLEQLCAQADGVRYATSLDSVLNFHAEMKHTFLCYENHQLVAFLHVFAPTHSEAEISALTLPQCRTKGYFTALLLRAIEELKAFQISDVLFVSQPSYPRNQVIKHFGAAYEFSEYIMSLERKKYMIQIPEQPMSLFIQRMGYMKQLIEVSVKSFHDSSEEAQRLIEMALLSANRQGYMAVFNDKIIGICFARFEGAEAFLYGLGIHTDYQGKGFGGIFLKLVLNELFSGAAMKVKLEVESRNASALHLYTKTGFASENTVDYYRATIKNLLGV
ncbi:GNAT family N-acetyltransferase [Sporolactobacillus shoreicorticis]|uniref:GNAT family N-acetyltransferase n=1 Tax=Sporolactobacillus shoreicorticis TaxID=1923877 RepID=A0ABW5S7E0_9BACL|nr:GNAT family N-acetyltransferase [Sporolactobacillus shoreicorticis]MCO7125742.1 GNAT family N-acetyltransferase [Sporolactobacillus shoreicorticis]